MVATFTACGFDLGGAGTFVEGRVDARDASDTRLDSGVDANKPDLDAGLDADAALVGDSASGDATVDADLADVTPFDSPFESASDAGFVSLSYNVNGQAFTSTSTTAAGIWLPDPGGGGICGPAAYAVGVVYNTTDGPLYRGGVHGDPLACSVGAGVLPPGNYDVTLYFAEIYYGPGCAGGGAGTGARIFDVELEGKRVETDLDVFALGKCLADPGGAGSPVIRTHRVTITDGTLDVTMDASVTNATLSAIRVEGPV